MKKNRSVGQLTVVTMAAMLFTSTLMKAQTHVVASPCDDKTVVSCGVEYTATLQPNSGYWVNYTDVSYNYTGSEKVFEFKAPKTGAYKLDLNQGEQDADFFIMDACSNTATNLTHFYWTGEQAEYIDLQEGVTYYIIADLYQSVVAPTTVSLKINCPENVVINPPAYDCYQGLGIPSSIDDGLNLDPINVNTLVANDFTVPAGSTFTLKEITIDTNQVQVPDHAVFNIRKDVAGVPGAIVKTINADTTSSIMYSVAFGEPVYHVVFDLTEPVDFEAGKYWLEPKLTTPEPSTVWWVGTASGTDGATPKLSEDGGATWENLDGLELVFFVAGDCSQLGVSDAASSTFTYYPNPVNTTLNLKSQQEVKFVEVYSVTGQRVLNAKKLANGQVDVHSLAPGNYVFKVSLADGSVKTFKITKK